MTVDIERLRQIANSPFGGSRHKEKTEVMTALPELLDELERARSRSRIWKALAKKMRGHALAIPGWCRAQLMSVNDSISAAVAAERAKHLGSCGCGDPLKPLPAGDWTVVLDYDGEHVWRGVGGRGDRDEEDLESLEARACDFPVGARLVTRSQWCSACGEEQDANAIRATPEDGS